MTKLRVAVVMGGTNTEHEVSLVSANAILNNLDQSKYDITPILIGKDNTWSTPKAITASYQPVLTANFADSPRSVTTIKNALADKGVDIVFPVLHGPFGEDGTIQGMLDLLRIPYVGCGVAGSAVCMDKVMQKDLCQAYGIPQVRYYWLSRGHWQANQTKTLKQIKNKFAGHFPLFVKPANSGSSVGVTKVKRVVELKDAIRTALTRDTRVVIEHGIDHAREIECSVLGPNHAPETSILGEIVPHAEFYNYETKYINDTSEAIIPAKLNNKLATKIQATAKLAFEILGCDGLARVDFLLDPKSNKYYLNELNTMPGFTPISMYPKLWEASGLSYPELLDRLIKLALNRHAARSQLNFSRT